MTRAATPAAMLALLLVACSGTIGSPQVQPTLVVPGSLGPRPSSPAKVEVVQPASGATVTGTTVHIALKLTGARLVSATTTAIRPDEGHVHLYVDNQLVSMNYGLEQDLPVHPGTFVMKAEFVAADHAPFNPRVYSPEIFFTVRP
jgi:hypothetical protein